MIKPHVSLPKVRSVHHVATHKGSGARIAGGSEKGIYIGNLDDLAFQEQGHPLGQPSGLKDVVGH
jgi:hypothetical protein